MAFVVKEKGAEKESYKAKNFLNACKWCVKYADLIGDNFEILRVEKRGRTTTIEKECDFETLA